MVTSVRLVALMLGQLRMNTKGSLEQYNTVCRQYLFEKKHEVESQDGTFKASTLEAEMKRVVAARPAGNVELMMIDESLAGGLGRV